MHRRFYPYLFAYALLLIAMAYLLCNYSKGESHILLNGYHTAWLNSFFKYYTKLAEWPFYVIAAIPLFIPKYRWWTYMYAASELGNACITTIIKQSFNMPRPKAFFGDQLSELVPIVDGVRLHSWHSFPSGHTATFFIFFTTIALLCVYYKHQQIAESAIKRLSFCFINMLLVVLAALGSYSRIYLSQHFLLDCFVGSIIGIAVPCCMFTLFIYKKWDKQRVK
ncbi:MAG: phosphatase PAP2 family protein [Salinivirgaceae bacterium]|nr:phosphatase PAP2 family protein [Salinivirgaceae bacterium]